MGERPQAQHILSRTSPLLCNLSQVTRPALSRVELKLRSQMLLADFIDRMLLLVTFVYFTVRAINNASLAKPLWQLYSFLYRQNCFVLGVRSDVLESTERGETMDR